MADISLQRNLGQQVMIVTGKKKNGAGGAADFRERMLSFNHIEGLLDFEITGEGGEKTYQYDIEDKSTLEEFFSKKKPDRARITQVLGKLLKTVCHGREYMLSENDYIIRADTVFVDDEDNVYVACFPSYDADLRDQLASLAEYLMKIVDYSDESAVLLVYGFYMRTREKKYTLDDILKTLDRDPEKDQADKGSYEESRTAPVEYRNPGNINYEPDSRRIPYMADTMEIRSDSGEYVKPDPAKVFSESPSKLKLAGILMPLLTVLIIFILLNSGLLINPETGRNDVLKTGFLVLALIGVCFEAEKILWGSFAKKLAGSIMSAKKESAEATVFLYGDDTVGYPFSLVSDDQPAINVSHFPYFVGKDAKHCDYVMATQVGISRYHMKIDRDGDGFTICDLNSTNGTFINGERLAPHLPHKIKRGDELRIGKCIYYCT